jgi:hypothetical protein
VLSNNESNQVASDPLANDVIAGSGSRRCARSRSLAIEISFGIARRPSFLPLNLGLRSCHGCAWPFCLGFAQRRAASRNGACDALNPVKSY